MPGESRPRSESPADQGGVTEQQAQTISSRLQQMMAHAAEGSQEASGSTSTDLLPKRDGFAYESSMRTSRNNLQQTNLSFHVNPQYEDSGDVNATSDLLVQGYAAHNGAHQQQPSAAPGSSPSPQPSSKGYGYMHVRSCPSRAAYAWVACAATSLVHVQPAWSHARNLAVDRVSSPSGVQRRLSRNCQWCCNMHVHACRLWRRKSRWWCRRLPGSRTLPAAKRLPATPYRWSHPPPETVSALAAEAAQASPPL
jgi:hypothetical protein